MAEECRVSTSNTTKADMTNTGEIFEDVLSNCDVLLSSLRQEKDGDTAATTVEILNDYHTNLFQLSKLLSHEATKFAVAHSSPPYPDTATTKTLAGGLCNAANQLVGCYLLLPSSAGATFLRSQAEELETLIESVKNFAETMKNIILKSETLQAALFSTGILWSFCDKIPLLPKSNSHAVNRVLRREEQLIDDAIKELDETSADCDFDSSHDSDNDPDVHGIASDLMPSVKGLAKTSAALLRKVKKLLDVYCSTDYRRLDLIAEIAATLSSTLDDLVCSLYSPVNVSQALSSGMELSSRLQEILAIVRELAGEEDQKWIELIDKGIKHNLHNLQTKASSA